MTLFASLLLAAVSSAASDAATPLPAAAWHAVVDEHGLRMASSEGALRFGDLEGMASLRLVCRPGSDGSVAWKLVVAEPDRYDAFGFDDFEGPDAPAASHRLTELRLIGGLMQTRITAEVGGWYGGTGDDGFVLAFSAPANAASDAALLADTIGTATSEIVWRTASHADTTRGIEARFDAREAAPAVREAMMGCGPPPELGEMQIGQWMGRNPAAVDLWRQRPIEWRLKGLLGPTHQAVLARLASAGPLGRAGDVAFVAAPDRTAERNGVVVMFALDGDTEVVLVDDGVVSHHRSGTRPIKPPQAVREFIAERMVAAEPEVGPEPSDGADDPALDRAESVDEPTEESGSSRSPG